MGFTGSNLRSKFKQCTSCLFKLHVWHHHCSQVIAQDVLDQSEFFLWVLFPEGIDGSFSFLAWQGFPNSKNFQFPPNGVEFFQVGKIQPQGGEGGLVNSHLPSPRTQNAYEYYCSLWCLTRNVTCKYEGKSKILKNSIELKSVNYDSQVTFLNW